ncbi:hypothetical protein P4O66_000355 [Electrophorus voltai]|uniref:Uncharacterized protein n=1 Tax=Electrophorus voltai TaxID=2609070 RepID=A0AAD9E022_9TELE|nr:hypothetical protein P4O66_000355 [Electrophorus voltai]
MDDTHHLKLNPSKTELLFITDYSFVTYEGFDPFSRRKLPSTKQDVTKSTRTSLVVRGDVRPGGDSRKASEAMVLSDHGKGYVFRFVP